MSSIARTHPLPSAWLHKPIRIALVGCGGTGSQVAVRLPALCKSIRALGHPHGLHVTIYDPDTVADHNTLRQNFFASDIGLNKATITVNRLNIAHDLDWVAKPTLFDNIDDFPSFDIVIGCVDTKGARRTIAQAVMNARDSLYWIDAGNEAHSGQVVIGQNRAWRGSDEPPLPMPHLLFPELVEGTEDTRPSCSARDSLMRQGMATNLMASTLIVSWLSEALQHGVVSWHGGFFNLKTGNVVPLKIDPRHWPEQVNEDTSESANAAA